MVVTDVVASSSDDDATKFFVTPTSLSAVTKDEPVNILEDSFDISVSPEADTTAVLEEIIFHTNSPDVTGTTETGFTVTVSKSTFGIHYTLSCVHLFIRQAVLLIRLTHTGLQNYKRWLAVKLQKLARAIKNLDMFKLTKLQNYAGCLHLFVCICQEAIFPCRLQTYFN